MPKEECVSVAMHQFKPYMLASFTDGYIRVFDTESSTNLGRIDMGNVTGMIPEPTIEDKKKPDEGKE